MAPTRLTLGEHLTTYLQHSRHKPQTLSGYERLARLHITPHLGHLPLSDITPGQLNRLYRRLESEGSPAATAPCP